MDTEKQRQRRRDDARLTEGGNARSEQLNTRSAYRVANHQSLAWIRTSKARLVFRYEISDLLLHKHTINRYAWTVYLLFFFFLTYTSKHTGHGLSTVCHKLALCAVFITLRIPSLFLGLEDIVYSSSTGWFWGFPLLLSSLFSWTPGVLWRVLEDSMMTHVLYSWKCSYGVLLCY